MSEPSRCPTRSLGIPFWIGCVVAPVVLLILLGAFGILDDCFTFLLFAGVVFSVFGPIGGLLLQAIHDLLIMRRLHLLSVWDYVLLLAIGAAFCAAGYVSLLTYRGNYAVWVTAAFVYVLVLVYAKHRDALHNRLVFGKTMKRLLQILAVVAVIAAILTALHISLTDGLDGLIWGIVLSDDTTYAVGYTDAGWRAIRVGMAEEDVSGRIGKPFSVCTNRYGSVIMYWSKRGPTGTCFRIKTLKFRDGRVSEKYAEFYEDF